MTAMGRIMASALLAVWLLLGCGSTLRFDYSGLWRGRLPVEVAPGTPSDVRRSLEKVELNITPQGRFELYESATSKEGEIERTGTGANLVVKSVLGQRVERQPEEIRQRLQGFAITPQADGKLVLTDRNRPEVRVMLEREAKPGG